MYTLSFQRNKIYAFYNLDTPSGEAGQRLQDVIASIPELKNLSGKISESELYHRARVISKLKEFSKDPRKTFGATKSTLNSVGVENAINNMKELITALSTNENIQNLGNKEIVAWFKGWDGVDDTNVAVMSGTRMTYRKFLSNVINDSELVANLFARPSESREKTEEKEIIEQRTRLGTFLVALESRNTDNEYKTMFRQAHQALIEKNLTKAKDILRKTLKSEWNIDVESVVTEQGKIAALRAIGATHEAAQSTVKQAANLKDKPRDTLSSKEKDLIDAIHNNLDAEKKKNRHLAGDIYGSMLRSIPETDPYRKQVERSRESMIDEIASEKAYINILDGYIKKNKSEGLGSMFEAYDEMRGLYGVLNFTDENAKMTKEIAIMLASFVLTAGVGPALGALGAGARILTAGKTIDVASKTGAFARNVARARNVATSTVAKSGNLLQGASTLDKTMSASRLGKIGWEATKFTTADSFIRTLSREAGEKSGFDSSFGEKLAKNAAMFGLFSGMEKFVSGPLKARAIEALGIKSGITQFTIGTTILTTGDITAMWVLGMAESGNLHVPEAMEIYQALAFRIGMKGTEKLLPKLSEKFAELKSKRKGTTEVGGTDIQTPKVSIERNTKYYEQADKFVISKPNKSDIRRFQKEGFDLAEIGFDGWNVRQAQKKGEVSYILTKNGSPGEHTFMTLEALQRFLTTDKSVFQGASGKPTQPPSMRDPDMAYGAKLETESPYTLNIGKAPSVNVKMQKSQVVNDILLQHSVNNRIEEVRYSGMMQRGQDGGLVPHGEGIKVYKNTAGITIYKEKGLFHNGEGVRTISHNYENHSVIYENYINKDQYVIVIMEANGDYAVYKNQGGRIITRERDGNYRANNGKDLKNDITNEEKATLDKLSPFVNKAEVAFKTTDGVEVEFIGVNTRGGKWNTVDENRGIFEYTPDFETSFHANKIRINNKEYSYSNMQVRDMYSLGTYTNESESILIRRVKDRIEVVSIGSNMHNVTDKGGKVANKEGGKVQRVGDKPVKTLKIEQNTSENTNNLIEGYTNLPKGPFRNESRLRQLREIKGNYEVELTTKLEQLKNTTSPILIKSFKNNTIGDSASFMKEALDGTQMKLNLWDNIANQKGYAIYEKTNGKWIHKESNVSGDGVHVAEEFLPLKKNDGTYRLQNNKQEMTIQECEFSIPHNMYVTKYLQPIREKLINPKVGDIILLPNNTTWRYAQGNPPWVEVNILSPALTSNVGGTRKTSTELQEVLQTNSEKLQGTIQNLQSNIDRTNTLITKESARPNRPVQSNNVTNNPHSNGEKGQQQDVISHSDNVDINAQSRINTEHGINKSYPGISKADILGGSFRSEIDAIMKMDDATFQKNYTEIQYRKGKEGARPYESEMYEAVAKVRGVSDEYIIMNAKEIMADSRKFLGSRHLNRGPSDLSQVSKAQIIAENTALRYRIKEIIGKKDPLLAEIVENPINLASALNNDTNWKKWTALGLIPLILGALYLTFKDKNPDIPAPQAGDTANQDTAVSYCENFSNNPKSKLNLERQSDAGEGIILTEKRRENISQRWMRTQEWKELETAITQNAQVAQRLSDEFHNIFSEVQENPSVSNVQELQRITGMNAEDAKTGQDGILGPRTTKRIRDYIISCMNPKAVQNNEPSSETKPITQVQNVGREEIRYDDGEWEDVDEEAT